jgi:hypothetical protein|tara:strand:+ start:11798 stop:12031 length:234 start_codon:yes stop_codon:yes gene_type:complete
LPEHIKWIDASSHGGPGWVSHEEAENFSLESPPVMSTVGFVIYETDSYMVLTDTIGEEECSSIHKIPKVMILERTNL